MPETSILALTYADTRDFLRGVRVLVHEGDEAAALIRDVFMDRQAQESAFAALAAGSLELVPLVH